MNKNVFFVFGILVSLFAFSQCGSKEPADTDNKALKEKMNALLDDLKETQKKLSEAIADGNPAEIARLRAEINDLQIKLTNATQALEVAKHKNTSLEAQLAEKNKMLAEKDKLLAEQAKIIEQLNKTLEEKEAKIADLTKTISGLTGELTDSQNTASTAQGEKKAIKEQLDVQNELVKMFNEYEIQMKNAIEDGKNCDKFLTAYRTAVKIHNYSLKNKEAVSKLKNYTINDIANLKYQTKDIAKREMGNRKHNKCFEAGDIILKEQ